MNAVVFLGAGRITSALIAGLRLTNYKPPIVVYDRNRQKMRALRREFHVDNAPNLESATERAQMLIIAVRPASVSGLLAEIAACATKPRLCISLAAGVPLTNLTDWLGSPMRWARAMPSPVSRVGQGLTALSFHHTVDRTERTRVRRFF